MFGITLRTGLQAAVMPILAAVLGRVLDEMIPMFDAPDSMLATAFTAVSNHALLIGLLAALVTLIAAAVTESEVRV